MIINRNKPEKWGGEHILICRHCIGKLRCKSYAMYCDVVGRMTATGKVRVRVYGERWYNVKGLKSRYVPIDRVKKYNNYFKD